MQCGFRLSAEELGPLVELGGLDQRKAVWNPSSGLVEIPTFAQCGLLMPLLPDAAVAVQCLRAFGSRSISELGIQVHATETLMRWRAHSSTGSLLERVINRAA